MRSAAGCRLALIMLYAGLCIAVTALVRHIAAEVLARVFAPNFARSADRDREHENCCQTEEARATAAAASDASAP